MKCLRATTGLAAAVLLLVGQGCTQLIDHNAAQCVTNDDCLKFHNHPTCMDGLCMASLLQPDQCFLPSPTMQPSAPADFLNQCSTGYLPSSRDNMLGACLSYNAVLDDNASIKPPPAPAAPMPTSATAPTALCKNLAPPNTSIIYLSGSSNFQPLLSELAPAVVKKSNIAAVFRITTSCTGVRSMNPSGATYATDHVIKDPTVASDSYAQIFTGVGPPQSCLLGNGGVPVDIGESEIFPDTCGNTNSPETVSEGLGPILPIVFAVPQYSTERAISYQGARQVFGGGGGVKPWEDPNFIYSRASGTATLRLIAKQLDLMPTQVWGIDQGNASAMAMNLAGISDPGVAQSAIGIIGSDFYDSYRGSLKALGFQANNQLCAYLPDSALTSLDKINVRDGHYPLWGRIHFFTGRVNGMPASPVAFGFVSRLTIPNLDPDILNAFIDAGFVPPCAMKVKRETELGDPMVDDPPAYSCGCAFDARVTKTAVPPGCTSCTANGDCTNVAGRPSCNYGFCEPTQ